jgi:dihydroorotate dehydrogenase
MFLFISPPFGNYIHLPNTISIRGTFTYEPRPGLFMQIFKTLRYSKEYQGWINHMGFRNKGIHYALDKYRFKKDSIISLGIRNENDIQKMLKVVPKEQDIELNTSCPNVEKSTDLPSLHKFINPTRKWCILKLSPYADMSLIDNYYEKGFRQFHCCNTVPDKLGRGGISGKIIRPYTLKLTKEIKTKYPDTIIIAGGGVKNIKDLIEYKECGADHISVSTVIFNPIQFLKFYYDFYKM